MEPNLFGNNQWKRKELFRYMNDFSWACCAGTGKNRVTFCCAEFSESPDLGESTGCHGSAVFQNRKPRCLSVPSSVEKRKSRRCLRARLNIAARSTSMLPLEYPRAYSLLLHYTCTRRGGEKGRQTKQRRREPYRRCAHFQTFWCLGRFKLDASCGKPRFLHS